MPRILIQVVSLICYSIKGNMNLAMFHEMIFFIIGHFIDILLFNIYRWKGDQMFYLLVKISFAYLLPVSLKSLCVSVLSTKRQFRSVL